jgi:hypothetical protein
LTSPLLPISYVLPISRTEKEMQQTSFKALANRIKALISPDFRIGSECLGVATTNALLCDCTAVVGSALAFGRGVRQNNSRSSITSRCACCFYIHEYRDVIARSFLSCVYGRLPDESRSSSSEAASFALADQFSYDEHTLFQAGTAHPLPAMVTDLGPRGTRAWLF